MRHMTYGHNKQLRILAMITLRGFCSSQNPLWKKANTNLTYRRGHLLWSKLMLLISFNNQFSKFSKDCLISVIIQLFLSDLALTKVITISSAYCNVCWRLWNLFGYQNGTFLQNLTLNDSFWLIETT
jgi:hypothetical protein